MHRSTLPWLLAAAAVLASPAGAQDPDPADAVSETVVVSASRFEQSLDDVAANVTVLSSAEIDTSAALTADDLLRQVPGFSLFRRSSSLVAHPTSQGVSLRGIGPSGVSRTLVLLDGIPLNDPFGGWVYWSRVPVDAIDHVEVVRGGGSSVWGNAALGGVVQLFTRDPKEGQVSLRMEAGERSTVMGDASLSERWSSSGLHVGLNFFDTDGFHVVAPEDRGSIDIPATSEHTNFGLRYSVDPSDSTAIAVRGSYFDEDRGNGTPLTGNETETGELSLRLTHVGAGGEWQIGMFGQDQEFGSSFSSQAEDRNSESPANDQFLVDSEGFGLSVQWLGSAGQDDAHLLTAGGELRTTEGVTNENFFFSDDDFLFLRRAGGEQRLTGLFLQDTWSGDRWQLQVGVRGDRWDSEAGFQSETSRITGIPRLDLTFQDRDETEFSPRIAAIVQATDGIAVRGSLYESFRAPSINELFRPFRVRSDITAANEELVPENLLGAEIGANFTGRKKSAKLTTFWNQIDDPIANVTLGFGPGAIDPCGFTPGGGACRQRQNLDRTRVLGYEAEGEFQVRSNFRLWASYLYTDTEIVEARNQRELEGNRIAQVPRNQATLRATYSDRGGFAFSVQGRYSDAQFEDDLNQLELGEYVVWDLVASKDLREGWNVFLRLENITHEDVEVGRTGEGLVSIGTPFLVHGGVRVRLRH